MIILEILVLFWMLCNIPAGAIAITVVCFSDAEYYVDIFLYPMLIRFLRKKLSILGTAITTIIFSIFFAPAIIFYFILLLCFIVVSLIVKGFIYIFRRKY